MNLHEIKINQTVCVKKLGGNGELRQHFLDMGIIPGAQITLVKYAPLGDPMEFRLHGYELTLRIADAEQIEVEELSFNLLKIRQPCTLVLVKAVNFIIKMMKTRCRTERL